MGRSSKIKEEKRIQEGRSFPVSGRRVRGTTKEKIKKLIPSFLVFIVILVPYLITIPRHSVGYADSDEMIVGAYTLGVLHPPGYPLFPIFGKVFTLIPIGSIAFRVGIFTSVCGALTCVSIFLTCLKIFECFEKKDKQSGLLQKDLAPTSDTLSLSRYVPAAIAALSLGFSYLFWTYSIVPEKYSPYFFSLTVLTYLMVSWYFEQQQFREKTRPAGYESKYPYWIAFVFGLVFLSHQSVAYLVPGLIIFAWITDRTVFFSIKKWIKMGFLFGLTMLLNVHTILAAAKNPLLNPGNPNDWEGLYKHIFRFYYGGVGVGLAGFSIGERLSQLTHYFNSITSQFGIIVIFVCVAGIFLLLRKQRGLGISLFVLFFLAGPFMAFYAAFHWDEPAYLDFDWGVQERIYFLSSIFIAIFVGVASYYLLDFIRSRKVPILAAGLLLVMLLPGITFALNFKDANKSDYDLFEKYINGIFDSLEPNAILIVTGDSTIFGTYYYQAALHKREDVTLVRSKMSDRDVEALKKREPSLFSTKSKRYSIVIHDIISSNLGKRPIYSSIIPGYQRVLELGLAGTPYYMVPDGLVSIIKSDFELPQADPWSKIDSSAVDNLDRTSLRDHFQKNIPDLYALAHHTSGVSYLALGYYDVARKELEIASRLSPDYYAIKEALNYMDTNNLYENKPVTPAPRLVGYHVKLAVDLVRQKQYLDAVNEFYEALEIDPENANTHLNLAQLFDQMGYKDEAKEERDKATKIKIESANR